MNFKREYFECSCFSPEHTLSFWFDDDKEFSCIYVSVFLSNDVWYKRLIKAVKYVFGYKCRYGHFDEFLFKENDVDRLISVISQLKKVDK